MSTDTNTNVRVRVKVSEELVVVLDLWALMLVLTMIQSARLQRALSGSSFAVVEPTLIPNLDASPTGISLIPFQITGRYTEDQYGRRHIVGHHAVASYGSSVGLGYSILVTWRFRL